jgi:hypothetical protein
VKKRTLVAILLAIYFIYNITVLSIWRGWTGPSPPPLALLMGPGMFVIAVAVTGITTYIAARFLPKEAGQAPPAQAQAAPPGPRRVVALTSREAGIVASFSGVNFAWNALGLIFVIFPPGSWSISGIMPQLIGMATGPVGLIIAHFIGGLLWYDFPWGTFNFMLSSTWLATIAYYFYRDVAKKYRYPILFLQTFLLHQYDVYSWALWASNFAKLAPVDFVVPATLVFIGPWSLLNAIPIVIIVALLDRFSPGLMRPTWLDRYAT